MTEDLHNPNLGNAPLNPDAGAQGQPGAIPLQEQLSEPQRVQPEDFIPPEDVTPAGTYTSTGHPAMPVELMPSGLSIETKLKQTWMEIETTKSSFENLKAALDVIMDGKQVIMDGKQEKDGPDNFSKDLPLPPILLNSQAYSFLKYVVEYYVRKQMSFPDDGECLPVPDFDNSEPGVLTYYKRVLKNLGAFTSKTAQAAREAQQPKFSFLQPQLKGIRSELFWSYWHEEGRLSQTIQAIALRFQNVKLREDDPLANLEIDSLRPLANLLFGYIDDRYNRLTIERRNFEYQAQYGISLFGQNASRGMPAVSRTGFIEAFHNLLYRCILFYRQADNLTVRADSFPVLNGLREVNLLLTEGMHNQFNDLSVRARVEMMTEQYILSRQEIKEFLRGKAMVLYAEDWMGVVDTMKTIQGWPSASIKLYHELAEYGEDILLSIRYIPWTQVDEPDAATAWAMHHRKAIQRYIYTYQALTGVDISEENHLGGMTNGKHEMPGRLLQQRFTREKMLRGR